MVVGELIATRDAGMGILTRPRLGRQRESGQEQRERKRWHLHENSPRRDRACGKPLRKANVTFV